MELILLSVFGIAFLFSLELCGLVYERRVRQPHPASAEFPVDSRATGQRQYRWLFVDDAPTEPALHCLGAANDAGVTTIRLVMSRDSNYKFKG